MTSNRDSDIEADQGGAAGHGDQALGRDVDDNRALDRDGGLEGDHSLDRDTGLDGEDSSLREQHGEPEQWGDRRQQLRRYDRGDGSFG